MEMTLRAQSPLCCPRSKPELMIRPAAGGSTQSIMRYSGFTRRRAVHCMVSSSDYPKRLSKRSLAPKTKGSNPRGFAPKPSVESTAQKNEQRDIGEGAVKRTTSGMPSSSKQTKRTSAAETQTSEVDSVASTSSSASAGMPSFATDSNRTREKPTGYRAEVDGTISTQLAPLSIVRIEAEEKMNQNAVAMDHERTEEEHAEYCTEVDGIVSAQVAPLSIVRAGAEEKNNQRAVAMEWKGTEAKHAEYLPEVDGIVSARLAPLSIVRAEAEEKNNQKAVVRDHMGTEEKYVEYRPELDGIVSAQLAPLSIVRADAEEKNDQKAVAMERKGTEEKHAEYLPEVDGIVSARLAPLSIIRAEVEEKNNQKALARDHTGTEEKHAEYHPELDGIVSARLAPPSIVKSEAEVKNDEKASSGMPSVGMDIEITKGKHSEYQAEVDRILSAQLAALSIVKAETEEKIDQKAFLGTEEECADYRAEVGGVVSARLAPLSIVKAEAEEENDQKASLGMASVAMDTKGTEEKCAEYWADVDGIISARLAPLSIVSVCDKWQRKETAIGRELDVPRMEEVGITRVVESKLDVNEYEELEKIDQGGLQVKFDIENLLRKRKVDITQKAVEKIVSKNFGDKDFTASEDQVETIEDEEPEKVDQSGLRVNFDIENLLQNRKVDITKQAVEKMVNKNLGDEDFIMSEDEVETTEDEESLELDDNLVAVRPDTQEPSEEMDDVDPKAMKVMLEELAEENFDIENLSRNRQVDITEQAVEKMVSKNLGDEDFIMSEDEVETTEDEEPLELDENLVAVQPDTQEPSDQTDDVDPEAMRVMLEELAEENSGNKVFVFPAAVEPDQVIDVYLNRSLSALANEPDILIKGAFNGWKWKFFTEKLQKTELKGDWWSCKLYIPKQAYRVDFVFFNGGTVYENNNSNDFLLIVSTTMDEVSFEDFLLEEKRKELERLAAEEAERERQAEEHCRREQEKAAREADKARAKAEVEMKKDRLRKSLSLAMSFVDNVWYIEPSLYKGGERIRLYYNRSSRPLMHSTNIWFHGGYNNWIDGLSIAERLVRADGKDGDWWFVDVVVPDHAMVLDWVFADGPPGNARVYDNNGRQDFHAAIPTSICDELFWVKEEHKIYERLQHERKESEEAARIKAEKNEMVRAEMKEKSMRRFLLSQKHIVYTEPLEVHAGSTVTVVYNPSNTVLNGKHEVWFRCSFNRWTHQSGPLPPQKMEKAEKDSYLRAKVRVPLDAYMMDFVFSEWEDGGTYDNRNGMDYHIPVSGAIVKEPPMHIVHIAVEMAPIAKVGGLGDVVTSLSRAVQDLGHNVEVILPKYDCMDISNVKDFHFNRSFAWGGTEVKVWFGKVEGLPVYFLEPQNGMFWVGCVYGRDDDSRFGFFCHAALEFLVQRKSNPDIIHCHDWSSAPVAWLYKEHYAHYGLTNGRVIFTIHNLEFGVPHIGKAMAHCDKATTVSHTYSREVSRHSAIAPHLYKFHGILNGIDPDIWDPFNDKFIPVHYTSENVVEGKRAAKEALQQKLGLRRSDYPIVGVITRLTAQKGIHLIKHAISRTLECNGQVVLLGSAPDARIQNDFVDLANNLHSSHAGRVRLCLNYDEPLSHLIYAGADFILVPSLFEPCGLTQLVAMRYGSIPVVRKTGGLYDTVFDVDNDKERAQAQGLEPNGFSFDGADASGVDYALNRAISAWYDAREWFNSLCKRVMEQDWSWNRPALDYMELYHSMRK